MSMQTVKVGDILTDITYTVETGSHYLVTAVKHRNGSVEVTISMHKPKTNAGFTAGQHIGTFPARVFQYVKRGVREPKGFGKFIRKIEHAEVA